MDWRIDGLVAKGLIGLVRIMGPMGMMGNGLRGNLKGKQFVFCCRNFRLSSARAFMGELYTRFFGATLSDGKGREIVGKSVPLISSYFPEFPFLF
jgi:hypothetical protein